MRIGELAEAAGTTTRALRYYESLGLLPARRTSAGYRDYGPAELRLVEEIRTLRDSGFGLEETRPFVECLRSGHPAGDACPASLEVYRSKLAELDARIARLTRVRERVTAQLVRAEAGTAPQPRCELAAPTGDEGN